MNLKTFYERFVKNYFYFLNDPLIRLYENEKFVAEYDYCVERDDSMFFVDNTARLPALVIPINQKINLFNDKIVVIFENRKLTFKFYSSDAVHSLESVVNEY